MSAIAVPRVELDVATRVRRRTWYYGSARAKHGTCDTCGHDHGDDGRPLIVCRQFRCRKWQCFACFDRKGKR